MCCITGLHVSEFTMVNTIHHFPLLLPNWHGCLLPSSGLIERFWFGWIPLWNTGFLYIKVRVSFFLLLRLVVLLKILNYLYGGWHH